MRLRAGASNSVHDHGRPGHQVECLQFGFAATRDRASATAKRVSQESGAVRKLGAVTRPVCNRPNKAARTTMGSPVETFSLQYRDRKFSSKLSPQRLNFRRPSSPGDGLGRRPGCRFDPGSGAQHVPAASCAWGLSIAASCVAVQSHKVPLVDPECPGPGWHGAAPASRTGSRCDDVHGCTSAPARPPRCARRAGCRTP